MDSEILLIKSINTKIINKKIHLNNYNINYIKAGSGEPLLLVHGANIGWGQWYKNIADLSKYYTIYALDLPGSGKSTKIDFNKTKINILYLDIVRKFVEYQKLRNINYIGHSIGGWIGIKLASKFNLIKKLVLVNPVGFSNYIPNSYRLLGIYNVALFLSKTAMNPSQRHMKNFLQQAVLEKSTIEDKFARYYYDSVIREKITHPFLFINKISSFFGLRKEFKIGDEFLKIDIPTLFILGHKDKLTPIPIYKSVSNRMKRSSLTIIRNTSHVPPLEKPKEFNNIVTCFLNQILNLYS